MLFSRASTGICLTFRYREDVILRGPIMSLLYGSMPGLRLVEEASPI